jgi:hypothetical protein
LVVCALAKDPVKKTMATRAKLIKFDFFIIKGLMF